MNLSKELFLKIYSDEKLAQEIIDYIRKNEKKIERYLKLCRKNRWEPFLKKSPEMKLSLVFAFLPEVYERYRKKGISEEIFFSTMSDIKIWIDDHKARNGTWGLTELNWIQHHMNLNIFRLGRLQFQKFSYFGKKPYEKDGVKLWLGKKALNVHIPRGEKLTSEACLDSFKQAKSFFEKYYPEYPNNIFMCCSWLLYSKNSEYMKQGSNILSFACLFDLADEFEAPQDTYLWIYGKKADRKALMKNKKKKGSYGLTDKMPQETSLQKALTEYIRNGGSLGVGLGVRIEK